MDWNSASGFGGLGAGAGGFLGALIGDMAGEEDRERARRFWEAATGEYQRIDPNVHASTEEVVDVGPTAMERVGSQVDPATRDQQMLVLDRLMRMGLNGGQDAVSRAALNEATAESSAQESAARQGLQQRFAARGRGGGMGELAAQLSNAQGSAQRASAAAVRSAADSQMRALDTLAKAGSLSGVVRGQDYGQATDLAQARDRTSFRNADNRQSVNGRNASRQQQAATDTLNARFRRADGVSGGFNRQAAGSMAEEERKRRLGYGVGSGMGQVAGTAAGFV